MHTTQIHGSLQYLTLIQSPLHCTLHPACTNLAHSKHPPNLLSSSLLSTEGIRVWDIKQKWWTRLWDLELEQMELICCSDTYSFISSSSRNYIKKKKTASVFHIHLYHSSQERSPLYGYRISSIKKIVCLIYLCTLHVQHSGHFRQKLRLLFGKKLLNFFYSSVGMWIKS